MRSRSLHTTTRARTSVDTDGQVFDALLRAAVTAPMSAEETWQALDLDAQTLSRTSPRRLLELLADLSPDVAKGVWDFLRMCNPGWEAQARRPSGSRAPRAHQAALDAFLAQLTAHYGSIDVVIARLFLGAYLRGGFCAELVLDADARVAVDLATPDPASLSFRQERDPVRGLVWTPGQWQAGEWVKLDQPTFCYIPIDPLPAQAAGRAIAAPAVFPAVFLLAMLHDLRRVVQQQGWPRLDITVDIERLRSAMPESLQSDPDAFRSWVAATIAEVSTVYGALQPDDAYVHIDAVAVNRPVGAVDASSLGAIDGLVDVLERMLVRGLKTIPLLMGISEGVSEANANRQWELFAASIKAVQHLCESLLERLCTLALRAQGVPAVVQWRFAELRVAELLRDAQVEQLHIANARAQYDHGWISQDEAAQHGADRPTADQEAPRASAGPQAGAPIANDSADAGGLA